MHEKEKDLIAAFLRGQTDRRGLLKGLGAMGIAAGTAGTLLNMMSTQALAADFDWKVHKGKSLKLLSEQAPLCRCDDRQPAGLQGPDWHRVTYDVFPEDVYFDKVTAALSSGSTEYDAFMTGAYMTWTYGPAGWITDLKEWINDPAKTNPQYAWDDFLPGVKNSCAWNGQPGGALGSDDAKQWCIPWGFEQNNHHLQQGDVRQGRRRRAEEPRRHDLRRPSCSKDVGGGVYGIGVRGSRSWATIHPGFLSGYSNFGQKDLNVSADGKLSAAMNTAGPRRSTRSGCR
jgi:multiple sugar transport system substrate-binding protein